MDELTFTQIGEMAGVSRQRVHKIGFGDRTPIGVELRFKELAKAQRLQAAELQEIAMKYQEAARQARQLVEAQETQ